MSGGVNESHREILISSPLSISVIDKYHCAFHHGHLKILRITKNSIFLDKFHIY